jgi:hypothetical protein
MPNRCTHTSDWWKNMVPCCGCGAIYSDEEAEDIAAESSRNRPTLTAAQESVIERIRNEQEREHDNE